MITADSPLMTAEQAAIVAGCSANWIRRLIRNGKAEGLRLALASGKLSGQYVTTRNEAVRIGAGLTSRATKNEWSRKKKRKGGRA